MKTFVYLALIASVSAFNITPTLGNQEKLYIQSALSDDSLIQTSEGKIMEERKEFPGWHASMEGFPGTLNDYGEYFHGYSREIPERFQGDAAEENYYPVDKFTQKMLTSYATEVSDKGARTHKFVLTKDSAKDAAKEVLATHFAMNPTESATFLASNFDTAWDYYDVNGTGQIDTVGVSTFFRSLTKKLGALDLE